MKNKIIKTHVRPVWAELDSKGSEIIDPAPAAMPVGYEKPESLASKIKRYVRGAISDISENQGNESWKEANDFNVGDDFDPNSPYELSQDQEIDGPIEAPEEKNGADNNSDPGVSDDPVVSGKDEKKPDAKNDDVCTHSDHKKLVDPDEKIRVQTATPKKT